MSNDDGFDPAIAALLREAGARVVAPDGVEVRVLERLALTIPELGAPGDIASEGMHGSGTRGLPSPTGAGASLLGRLGPLLASFVVGATSSAVAMRVTAPRPTERVVYVQSPGPSTTAVFSERPSEDMRSRDMPSTPVSALPNIEGAARSPSPETISDSRFAQERLVLDTARTAFARGDHALALRTLEEHERAYAFGKLVEEREALFVRTLAESGALDQARARASKFRRRWPQSLLLPAVEAAVTPHP